MGSSHRRNIFALALVTLALGLCAPTASTARETEAIDKNATSQTTTAPVAYVYVSIGAQGIGPYKVAAYAAAANGSLTAVPGSPFSANVASMAVNGKFLFGSTADGISIAAYTMTTNGALHPSTTTEVDHDDPNSCDYPGLLHLDHTGSSLYREASTDDDCYGEEYESFQINSTTGALHYIGHSGSAFLAYNPLSFLANDVYAYQATCTDYEGYYEDQFQVFKRGSGGLLNQTGASAPAPQTQSSNDFYCRSLTAADPTNHVAVSMQDVNSVTDDTVGVPRLGVYTADSNGNLTTTSTHSNMAKTSVNYVLSLAMSPSGKLLAVAGFGGLQVFHFNGASPITPYTGLLTSTEISQVFWDDANHLYGIAPETHKLYVFTVTPTSVSAAPGSPHALASYPEALIVKPKT